MQLGIRRRELVLVCALIFWVLWASSAAWAPQPTPHNVKGRVFHADGSTGVDNGIPVSINDTNSTDYVLTFVSAPPAPPQKGSYSAVINGSDNDTIIVRAWNSTAYGTNTSLLAATTTTVHIVLNTTRPSESNATIVSPQNNTLYEMGALFNASANVSGIGGQNGTNCTANISFSNGAVLLLAAGDFQHAIGNISMGEFNTTVWSVTANRTGSSNITVIAGCASDGENFDSANRRTVYNITVKDSNAPAVSLESPANNSRLTASTVSFRYNVTDLSGIANCSLIINGLVNETSTSVEKNLSQSFTVSSMGNTTYNWSVNCTDDSTSRNMGASAVFNLTLLANLAPVLSSLVAETPVLLSPGTSKKVSCNATVTDENNASDIERVNATLYHMLAGYGAADDFNSHYTNASCSNTSFSLNSKDYTCGFEVQYFADSGAWQCNITVSDFGNLSRSANASVAVNDLVALNITPLVIEYGSLAPGGTSDDVNVTITNFGNVAINLTVDGFGAADGDNLSMACTVRNVSIDMERHAVTAGLGFDSMLNLTDAPVKVNFTLAQRTNDAANGNDQNLTHWKLRLPAAVQGSCNGTVTFTAILE